MVGCSLICDCLWFDCNVAAPAGDLPAQDSSMWVTSMLGAHGELAELSATEVDGFVTVEALHAETGYGIIQRCYRSWGLAAADLAKWVQKLSCLNTTASEPRRPRACRKPGSYDDILLVDHGLLAEHLALVGHEPLRQANHHRH